MKRRTPGGIGLLLEDLVRELICERDANGGRDAALAGLRLHAPKVAAAIARAEAAAIAIEKPGLRCDFCGKTQREVKKLIAGPTVYICDDCGGLVHDILVEDLGESPSYDSRARAIRAVVAAQWATMCALLDEPAYSGAPWLHIVRVGALPSAQQVVDGAA